MATHAHGTTKITHDPNAAIWLYDGHNTNYIKVLSRLVSRMVFSLVAMELIVRTTI